VSFGWFGRIGFLKRRFSKPISNNWDKPCLWTFKKKNGSQRLKTRLAPILSS